MKYGIQLRLDDNTVRYVSNSNVPCFSNDITDLAMFVQEKSAIDAVKSLRKASREPDGTLEVIAVDFVVQETVKVPYPPTKTGFVITAMIDTWVTVGLEPVEKYFNGSKVPGKNEWSLYRSFNNYERATTFDSIKKAETRIAQIIASAEQHLAYEMDEKRQTYSRFRSEEEAKSERERYIQNAKRDVEQCRACEVRPAT